MVIAMNKQEQKRLRESAAEQTLALSPLVGVSVDEVLGAARATAHQAIRKPMSLLRAGAGFSRKLVEVSLGKRHY